MKSEGPSERPSEPRVEADDRGATAATAAGSFLELLDVHAAFFELFRRHQEALLDRDFPRALARLLELRRAIEEHIDEEERLFGRLFAERNEVRGIPLELFVGEHRHLRSWLVEFEAATRRLDANSPTVRADVIELLDDEVLFKTFFRHHDEREKNLLYPAFDSSTPLEARRKLLDRFYVHKLV
jgi:hypothetical protein